MLLIPQQPAYCYALSRQFPLYLSHAGAREEITHIYGGQWRLTRQYAAARLFMVPSRRMGKLRPVGTVAWLETVFFVSLEFRGAHESQPKRDLEEGSGRA